MGKIRRFFFGGRKRSSSAPKAMDPPSAELPKRQSTIRRSMRRIRKSFKKEKGYLPPASKPHVYAKDEKAVRNSDCSFSVKYLGAIEVTESRGMSVCEEAAKKLRANPQHKVRAVLQVSGDALRVVEEGGQGLLVDQTIEKVSFCAPDRNDDRGFSYISRDGTTRRWLCHCFLSMKEPGERLSHAVGCAFAACLERKQQRDKLCGVQMEFDVNKTSFTRQGSFKQMTVTEQLQEEAQKENSESAEDKPAPAQPVVNPYAIPRRHVTDDVLQRQASFRGLTVINNNTPFKRNLSLRLNELPSTLQRQNQILETVPDLSPTSPTGTSHGTGVLTEHPGAQGSPPQQAQIHAQVHTGGTQPQKAPAVQHPVVFTQNVTPPPGYGEPPPVPQPVQPFGPASQPVQPSAGAQQPVAPQSGTQTNPWGDPQSYNPWGGAAPPAHAKPSKSEAEKWLEDTSRTVTQKPPPHMNGGGAAAISVNHNNANIATPPVQHPQQNVGTGINGSWVADISQSLQSTGSAQQKKTNGRGDPEFEAKWSQSPQKGPDEVNPFGNAVQTFEINL